MYVQLINLIPAQVFQGPCGARAALQTAFSFANKYSKFVFPTIVYSEYKTIFNYNTALEVKRQSINVLVKKEGFGPTFTW